ncbi:phosphatidylserine/phosphatidylglycerophosphate/cardiolipin synthase family protein [Flammeovirga sp. SJP92]|uniref:phospholipase D-like domain-containing protein n=1 Tax=Flammeovirga sp. SJP92 TaxID=1775430 RepID=UPI000788CE8A|nr:phospholipase D-like domain-containing protein [Flammeovirga sp. SJP92]KXX66528.1 hypothetical protein AVL50_31885 [Flammeovirga sp. SJP92]
MKHLLLLFLPLFFFSCEVSDNTIVEIPEHTFTFDEEFPLTVLPTDEDLKNSSSIYYENVNNIIDATPAGETIHINLFKFSYGSIRDHLMEAVRRGVEVHVMLDIDAVNNYTSKVLEDSATTFVRYVNYLSAKAINHNKYLLSSGIKTSESIRKNIVLQTSYNFTSNDNSKYQDMVMLADEELYNAFVSNYEKMEVAHAEKKLRDWTFEWEQYGQATVGFLPKITGGDIAVDIFSGVSSTAVVTIMNSKWEDDRPTLKSTLQGLLDQGTKINIMAPPSRTDNLDVSWENTLNEWNENYENCSVKWISERSIHNKTILIEDGENSAVWTGAHNFRQRSLRYNNEVILKLQHASIISDYKVWLETIFEQY